MEQKIFLTELSLSQLETLAKEYNLPSYRAKQMARWIYKQYVQTVEQMTDLPKDFRASLADRANIGSLKSIKETRSKDGTIKVLFSLRDGKTIEANYMPYPMTEESFRSTICVSTQVGCATGCPFCATGQQGFERNLTPGEIIEQVLWFARSLHDEQSEEQVTNVVFMGMGEPLANYDNLMQAIQLLNSPDAYGLGARNITISTSGLVPGIERLSKESIQLNLAVSLHASKDDLRDRLVPINKKYPLEKLIPACRAYVTATNRRITFEYTMFEGINDTLVQARQLVHLIAGMNCHVNLIAANRTGTEYRPSSEETIAAFAGELQKLRIQCTIRRSRGVDIDAGCGQLRARYK